MTISNSPPDSETISTPLTIPDPASLDELFSRDPLELTDSDVDCIVTKLREDRKRWAAEERESAAAGRRPNPRAVQSPEEKAKAKEAVKKLTIADLGIKL